MPNGAQDPIDELKLKAVALPAALVAAWIGSHAAPGLVRLISMWVHESGHAVTAWLCGYAAWPGPWFTPVGADRSILMSALVIGLLGFGAYRAWQANRRGWVAAAALTLLLALFCTSGLTRVQAQQLITFGGDGGCFVLGTLLMLTLFARQESPLVRNQLRWGFLIIGALAFMDAFVVWTGSVRRLPLGENENGLSDASVLLEQFGWTLGQLVHRYNALAHVCLLGLAITYIVAVVVPLLPERVLPE